MRMRDSCKNDKMRCGYEKNELRASHAAPAVTEVRTNPQTQPRRHDSQHWLSGTPRQTLDTARHRPPPPTATLSYPFPCSKFLLHLHLVIRINCAPPGPIILCCSRLRKQVSLHLLLQVRRNQSAVSFTVSHSTAGTDVRDGFRHADHPEPVLGPVARLHVRQRGQHGPQ